MDINAFFDAEFDEHLDLVNKTREATRAPFAELVAICTNAFNAGNKLLFFGNGGSAADAQHIATEFTVRYINDRRALPAIALTTDSSALTAIGNDFGFDYLFSRQIEALGRPGDIAIGISTSGNSKNVNLGLEKAREMGLIATGWTGKTGGAMASLCDPLMIVPSNTTARIQEMHIQIGQMLVGALEQTLGLTKS
ncbi:D-sedoheptulose 7-phosphate isomerase [Thalassospira alkalitolerans]|uniref:Phosphoheptose isomerase n=1 Tax=Thalassospira alkalitolerans TaxID=1293890 RepID=A0A1Y2LHD6_9PROT|nr:D-sedoheptulose 7-phosphate isomerase [Thalassospira alkalitolerans]OSQ50268.1 phosphoheptose isomerase [Thalassospira alkalitolerans]|tara:strand:+ start:47324 stop:47908 length:585 start_codon:yes stop_codon:yes gene_type:complete